MNKYKKPLVFFLFFFLLSVLPFYRIFGVRFVDGHDFTFHIQRIYTLEQSIRNGIIFPRWLPDALYGYGSPLFSVYWGIPYYTAVFLRFIGISFEGTYKFILLFPNMLAFFGMYLWIQSKWKSKSIAFISAVVYLFTPYRFLDTFIRSALGELFLFAFLPFVFYSFDSPQAKNRQLVGSIAFALMVYSHHGLAFFSLLLFILYIGLQLIIKKHPSIFIAQCKIIILGLLLSAFFWIPAFSYGHLLGNAQTSMSGLWFPPAISLLRSPWEGGYIGGERLIMSYEIGLVHIGILSIGMMFCIYSFIKKRLALSLFFWIGVCLLSIFFMMPFSRWFWIHIPFIANIIFPFRLLFIPMVASPIILAIVMKSLTKGLGRFVVGVVIITGVVFANRNHLGVLNKDLNLASLQSYRGSFDVGGECTPFYMDIKKIEQEYLSNKSQSEFTIVNGSGEIRNQSRTDFISTASIDMNTSGTVKIHRTYFPGWNSTINGIPVKPINVKNGTFISLGKGANVVGIEYHDTPLETFSNAISILSVVFLISREVRLFRRKKSFSAQ